jgi:argininosuccinate lyase
MKLWDKGYKVDSLIEKFTIGNDKEIDLNIVIYDCVASIAHAKMLSHTGILNNNEFVQIENEITNLINKINKEDFHIKEEDCHSEIEKYLVDKLGNLGKKIHTARSRNDQVLCALRLYEVASLKIINKLLEDYEIALNKKIEEFGNIEIPGYTHMQKAMPSSIGLFLSCFKESKQDLKIMVEQVIDIINKNPLGSAAGYGVPVFEIKKEITQKELGFGSSFENPIFTQLTRGKYEAHVISMLGQIMFDLNKLASDLILFSISEFSFISLPIEFCTGSSIMPQKKNPDVLELVRAKYHEVLGEEFKVKSMISNLISGYNRDMQLTKEPVIKSINNTIECLKIITLVIEGIKVNEEKCRTAMTKELYATEEAYKLVKSGMSFRDAYQIIGKKYVE